MHRADLNAEDRSMPEYSVEITGIYPNLRRVSIRKEKACKDVDAQWERWRMRRQGSGVILKP